jgi:AraC-like DNA-binding protein
VTTVASEWARWPRLAEELREAPSWQQRVGLMERFLLERLETGPRPSPEVAWTWRRLLASGGGVPIGRLAAEAGWSHKHLITRFRQQMGLRPKTAARLIRFDRVWRRLAQSEGPPVWADLAHEAGYADQAHLIREFRRFTGMTPTQFQSTLQLNVSFLRPFDGAGSSKGRVVHRDGDLVFLEASLLDGDGAVVATVRATGWPDGSHVESLMEISLQWLDGRDAPHAHATRAPSVDVERGFTKAGTSS